MDDHAGLGFVGRLRDAMNEHDLEALVAVFDPDVVSQTPAHPQRTFRGAGQVRRNWEQIFAAVPDLHAQLLDSAVHGDTVWSEWDWSGTRRDGSVHRMRGVTIQQVDDGRAVAVRFYMEPVEVGGLGPGEAVSKIVGGAQPDAAAVR
ncbi:MAG TPA: nuclear transport factor 2 family protein [Candidatus Limnocylindrales bacterium]|nr:nuclear transport factor 2 family protein [Candidatus Limnocylindrales bacterium]